MKKIFFYLIFGSLFSLFFAFPAKAVNEGDLIWSQISNPSSNVDAALAIAVDSSGIYIGGYSNNSQWRIEKRSLASGFLIWSAMSNNSLVTGIVIDSSGIYAVGNDYSLNNNSQWRIEKRSTSTGALINAFGTSGVVKSNPSNYDDWAHGIAVDSSGIYVIGSDLVSDQYGNWRIEKRSTSTGNLITTFGTSGVVRENPSLVNDGPLDIVVDSSGIYIVGYDYTISSYTQWRIEKRSTSTGALITSFDGDGIVNSHPGSYYNSNTDIAFSVAVDSTGIYVAGRSGLSVSDAQWSIEKRSTSTGALITSFDGDGRVHSNSNSSTEEARGIVVDSDGIYAVGHYRIGNNGGDLRLRIEKRSLTNGSLLWSRISSPTPNYYEAANAVAIDSSGIYVAIEEYSLNDFKWRIEKRTTQSLFTNLSVSPASGPAPLTSTLTAMVSGSATGTINYTFYCNRNDAGTNITTPYDAKFDGVSSTTQSAGCTYNTAGTYYPKVIVERGGLAETDVKTVIVSVPVNNNPQVTPSSVNQNLFACSAPSGETSLTPYFTWDYSDLDGDPQAKYQIVIKQGAVTIHDSGQVVSSSSYYYVSSGALNYNNTYDWTIQVWDSKGGTSGPVSGAPFSTVKHDLPYPRFQYFPDKPLLNSNTLFCSIKEGDCAGKVFTETTCPSSTCQSWLWTINLDAGSFVLPSTNISKNPVMKFILGGNQDVTLKVTDADSYFCQETKTIRFGLPLPEFKER